MDWTIKAPRDANHNPEVIVNGSTGKAPVLIDAVVGVPMTLDAGPTRDPDGNALTYHLVLLSGGRHRHPRPSGGRCRCDAGWWRRHAAEGGIPSGPEGGPREPMPRVTLQRTNNPRLTVTPRIAGTAHIVLAVEDNGSPTLTSYRRVILTIKTK